MQVQRVKSIVCYKEAVYTHGQKSHLAIGEGKTFSHCINTVYITTGTPKFDVDFTYESTEAVLNTHFILRNANILITSM